MSKTRPSRSTAPLLIEALPALAAELDELLRSVDEEELRAQLPELRLLGRCTCGDSFCAMVYTGSQKPGPPYPETLALDDAREGMIQLDIVAGRIIGIEVLYRDDVRAALDRVLPPRPRGPREATGAEGSGE